MRSDITRAVRAGRKRDGIANLPSISAYRNMANFEEFALSLYDAIEAQEKK
jgi:hypothetical protein